MTIIQKNGILVGIYAVFSVGTDLWTTGIHPWIAGIVSAEYSMGVKKLPTVKSLQVEFADLLTAKKEAYAELKKVRDELRDLTVHKANYEELRDLEEREKRKEKEHG